MSALPHLLHRLKRRIGLQMLHTREAQLDAAISAAELQIIELHDHLADLQDTRRIVSARLRMADAHPNHAEEPACN